MQFQDTETNVVPFRSRKIKGAKGTGPLITGLAFGTPKRSGHKPIRPALRLTISLHTSRVTRLICELKREAVHGDV